MAAKPRPRKPISAARIELHLWFADDATYRAFYRVPLGRKSQSVSDREWVLPVLAYPDGHIEATYRFTHTCRNDGAQRGDSERFFRAVCNAAGLADGDARLLEVQLLHREKYPDEPVAKDAAVESVDLDILDHQEMEPATWPEWLAWQELEDWRQNRRDEWYDKHGVPYFAS
ncbi:MAG TPA: hypothetical protein VNQ48_02615 [Microbacteriaceae bacterium]|nr:hypothetical protein [Microbacteriaceae bacterium]